MAEIDPQADRPVYLQIADLLRARIASGEAGPGAPLGTADGLARQLGVGVAAVRKALRELSGEGLVETRRGYPALVRVERERATVRVQRGSTLWARMPTPAERRELGMAEGVPVVVVAYGGRERAYAADRHVFTTS